MSNHISMATPFREVLDENLLSETVVQEYHDEYVKSEPYQYAVIRPICKEQVMRSIHDEMVKNMRADFKETDLFKVLQTAELGALSEKSLEEKMPTFLALRNTLYSAEFREIIEKITGCGKLTDRVDCSCNAYANSCHLLCHDDVIGTRRVSYIIYFSDPDEEWQAEDGGALELYPLEESSKVTHPTAGDQGVPACIPSKTVLPLFNSMLFFAVKPGKSYHSVQEVFSTTRPRLSISGWYHGETPPDGADKSSLQLIMDRESVDDLNNTPFQPLTALAEADEKLANNKTKVQPIGKKGKKNKKRYEAAVLEKKYGLTMEDVEYLKEYLSPEYLKLESIESIREEFINQSSIQLHDILRADLSERVFHEIVTADRMDGLGEGKPVLKYDTGISTCWQLQGPTHKRRYLSYKPSGDHPSTGKSDEVGELLQSIRTQVFESVSFQRYLRAISSLSLESSRMEVRRFRCGLDYTVAHYGMMLNSQKPKLTATLAFVNDNKKLAETVGKKSKKTNKSSKAKKAEQDANEDDEDEDEEIDQFAEDWYNGDVGGFECFLAADEDAADSEAAEVYRIAKPRKMKKPAEVDQEEDDENDGEDDGENVDGENNDHQDGDADETTLLSVAAKHNSLSLVLQDPGTMKFIKYVSSNAPGSRWDIAAEYEYESDDEEEESDEDEEEIEEPLPKKKKVSN